MNNFIGKLIEQDPDLMEKVRDCRALQEQRKKLEQEIDALQQEKVGAEKAISKIQDDAKAVETSVLDQRSGELAKSTQAFS